ncbi:helix-turn-helix domain-containing protein [Rummeliibacillus stabekisii]|uniref:helix-turn-helix domain-containing protein n=1 Tax=Rummeliibacillus stabekisii TaxID=241244 RepID=UPI00371E6C93
MEKEKYWGKLIKYHRQMQGLKQADLAIGICTASYLSRIENEVVMADENVYTMLFERLGIDFITEQKQVKQVNMQLDNFYEQLLTNQTLTVQELNDLVSWQSNELHQTLQLRAKLVYIRYLLSLDHLKEAEDQLQKIETFISWQQDRETQMYIGTSTYFCLSTMNYTAILEREDKLHLRHLLLTTNQFELANYDYHLAFAAHRAYAFQQALTYIERADQSFTHFYKPLFQLKLYSMKGVILNALGRYGEAMREFEAGMNLLSHVQEIQTARQYSSLMNNMAFSFESQGDYERAQQHYQKANDYLEDLHTVINWMRVSYRANDFETLSLLFDRYPQERFSIGHHLYQWELLSMALHPEEHTLERLQDIERRAFIYFDEQNHLELILFYVPLWATFYERLQAYKPASACYRRAFKASEKSRCLLSH